MSATLRQISFDRGTLALLAIADALRAGRRLDEALRAGAESLTEPASGLLREAAAAIEEGADPGDALQRVGDPFGPAGVAVLRAGLRAHGANALSRQLERYALDRARRRGLLFQLRAATTYASLVLLAAGAVGLLSLTVLLPNYFEVAAQLGASADSGLFTLAQLAAWLPLLALPLALLLLHAGRRGARWLPGVGVALDTLDEAAALELAAILGRSGVAIAEVFSLAAEQSLSPLRRADFAQVSARLRDGADPATALDAANRSLPAVTRDALVAGFAADRLPEALQAVADFHRHSLESTGLARLRYLGALSVSLAGVFAAIALVGLWAGYLACLGAP